MDEWQCLRTPHSGLRSAGEHLLRAATPIASALPAQESRSQISREAAGGARVRLDAGGVYQVRFALP